MPVLTALLGAVAALTLLTLLPGPDVAVATRLVLTVAGLAALLAASAQAYTLVKLAGAAYLIYLGVQTLWSSRRTTTQASPTAALPAERPWRTGLVTNLLNPKIAVFYTGLLPQLVPPGAPPVVTLGGLVLVHAVLSLAWLNVYALLLHRAAAIVQRPSVRRALERVTGLVLLGFGLRVATQDR